MTSDTLYRSIMDASSSECKCPKDECVKNCYHYADISVPIEMKPNAKLGDVSIECCGEPSVECCENKCGYTCEITVKQKISIRIPIRYEVDVNMDESAINCDNGVSCCK
ncbi:MAG: hypothetical protein ACI4II_04135 [Acutalibacteraceae bacterium]